VPEERNRAGFSNDVFLNKKNWMNNTPVPKIKREREREREKKRRRRLGQLTLLMLCSVYMIW